MEMDDSGGRLLEKSCVPCEGGVSALKGEELARLVPQVPGWKVVAEHHLVKVYAFRDFKTALDFVNRVGAVAESEGHHPDVYLTWGRVEIKIYTHKINGLTENDFILAAKIEQQFARFQ